MLPAFAVRPPLLPPETMSETINRSYDLSHVQSCALTLPCTIVVSRHITVAGSTHHRLDIQGLDIDTLYMLRAHTRTHPRLPLYTALRAVALVTNRNKRSTLDCTFHVEQTGSQCTCVLAYTCWRFAPSLANPRTDDCSPVPS